jgi:hypothetical protein
VFCMIILQQGDAKIKSSKTIVNRLIWRMEVWDKGEVDILVQSTVPDIQLQARWSVTGAMRKENSSKDVERWCAKSGHFLPKWINE